MILIAKKVKPTKFKIMCQKIINVLAIASFAVSGAVVASGLYVYVNRSSIIDGVKQQAIDAALGSLGGLGGVGGEAIPDIAPPAGPDAPDAGLGIPAL